MKQPVFVKIDEYHEIKRIMDLIKQKLIEAKNALEGVKELKHDEDSELELWIENLQDIESKILGIGDTFSEPDIPR